MHAVHALDQAADLLLKYGGHPAAAGFTVRTSDLPALTEELPAVVTLSVAALRWRESRIDVAPATRETLRKSIAHAG